MNDSTSPQFGFALDGLPDPARQAAFYQGVPVKRGLAWIIDISIIFILSFIVSILTLGLGFFVFFGIFAVVGFLYRLATLTSRSSTWGMRMMAIELRKGDGQRFDGTTALLHTAGTAISFATGAQIVSVIMMVATERGQGLPDLLLGTTALNLRARF